MPDTGSGHLACSRQLPCSPWDQDGSLGSRTRAPTSRATRLWFGVPEFFDMHVRDQSPALQADCFRADKPACSMWLQAQRFAEHVEPIVARLSDNDKCTGYMDFSTTERKSLSVSPRWTEVPFGTLSPHIQQPHLVTEHCCANTYANLHINVPMMRFDGAYDISILHFMHFLELKVVDEDLPAQYWSINKSPQLSLVWGQHYILN